MDGLTMMNEEAKKDEQTQGAPGQVESPTEVLDLNQAMQRIAQANQAPAAPAVETPAAGTEGAPGQADDHGGLPAAQAPAPADTVPAAVAPPADGTGGGTGGPATMPQSIDYNAQLQSLGQQVRREAQAAATAKLKEEGFLPATVADLQRKDEKTGEIQFINPDTKKAFVSANPRAEAQAWVRSFNDDLNAHYTKTVLELEPGIADGYLPQARVLEFAPHYAKMDKKRQEWFDALTEPYAVIKDGVKTYPSIDLFEVQKHMNSSVKFLTAEQEAMAPAQPGDPAKPAAPVAPPPKRPAMDIKTSGGAGEADPQAPQNINEAMTLYNKMQSEKKGKK